MIDEIEEIRATSGAPRAGTALDLACGGGASVCHPVAADGPVLTFFSRSLGGGAPSTGRDAVFLALRGWKTEAVDYQQKQCDKVRELAASHDVAHIVQTKCLDFEKQADTVQTALEPADLVNVARYLNREMMPSIRSFVKLGGFIVFHQFMVGNTKPHRPKFLLRENELATEHFSPAHGFRVLQDKVITISDGRTTSYFLAQKMME